MTRLTRQQNEVLLKLFRTAYCLGKQNFSLRSFPALIALQEQNGLTLSKAYRNRMAASSFVLSIANVMRCDIIEQINSREHFSLLIDGYFHNAKCCAQLLTNTNVKFSTGEHQYYTTKNSLFDTLVAALLHWLPLYHNHH